MNHLGIVVKSQRTIASWRIKIHKKRLRIGKQTPNICGTVAAILDFERRGRLGRVESATKGWALGCKFSNPTWRLHITRDCGTCAPQKMRAFQTTAEVCFNRQKSPVLTALCRI